MRGWRLTVLSLLLPLSLSGVPLHAQRPAARSTRLKTRGPLYP
jgi:hypothetical protein